MLNQCCILAFNSQSNWSSSWLSLGRNVSSSWRSSSISSYRWDFSNSTLYDRFLNGNLLAESFNWIFPLQLFKFHWSVLVQEFINWQVSSTNSDFDIVLLDLNSDSLGSKLIDTLSLTHEHNLEFGSLWIVIDELCELLINLVVSDWNINSNSLLQVNDVLLQSLNLNLCLLELLK